MDQQHLFDIIPEDKFSTLTKEELITLVKGDQHIIKSLQSRLKEVEKLYCQSEQKSMFVEENYITIKNKMFGRSSEKSSAGGKKNKTTTTPKKKIKLPSQRYPNAPIVEKDVELQEMPSCKCCGEDMQDSGLLETSEYLTSIPRQFFVVRQKRHKYRCSCCHGDLITAPAIPKIKVGGSYSDEMIIDVALSKYCDLIPIDRYTKMASRSGIEGLPPNSLINSTHNLAAFVKPAYDKVGNETKDSDVMKADETTHRMLEGDKKSNWYLWGFSTDKAAYFEAHDTRSGDVASDMLKNSNCEYLVSDVYSGYAKAVRVINEHREKMKQVKIKHVYCNAHARRKFNDVKENYEYEVKLFLWCYKKIYRLEKHKDDPKFPLSFEQMREWQRFYFKIMERKALYLRHDFSSKSLIYRALNYLLKNFEGLTLFLDHQHLPIDNNPQERLMRSPVIGRKTWLGTHSKKGAETSSILFSLVESCKLNKVNPRKYFIDLVEGIHQGKPAFTPSEYTEMAKSSD